MIESTETFVYIPLLDSLRQLLGNSRIRDLILKPARKCDFGIYYDISDGSIFKNKLKYKAAQSRLFLKLLPFFLHHLVDSFDEHFVFLMELNRIVQIIFVPVITLESIQILRENICEHLERFKVLFPKNNIIPKQHYLIHIPTMITLNGPLIRSSCFAFESAHIYFKRLAQNQSFKNLRATLAK